MTLLILIIASLAGGLLSLIGGILLLSSKINHKSLVFYAMPFAAGALLGAAFFSVLPETLHLVEQHPEDVRLGILSWTLLGFVAFFVLERSIRSFHHHELSGKQAHKSLIIVGDTVHNAIDGVAIGAAFLVNIPLGIATTFAVAAHEIPQEIGDFGFLLSKGMRPRNVLLVNAISSLATLVTAVLTFTLAADFTDLTPYLLAVVAGMFIYIAAADIIPAIHEQPHKRIDAQTILLIIGILIVPLTALAIQLFFGAGHTH